MAHEISPLNVESLRAEFPILHQQVHGKPLVYLDSAASAQKPLAVINAQADYLRNHHANVHRGVHTLSQRATDAFEHARRQVQSFLNAREVEEIIWTQGTTDGINLVAQTWGRTHLHAGDRILISRMEHHANIVPWQLLAAERGLHLDVAEIHEDGSLNWDSVQDGLNRSPKLVAMTYVSNTLGTVNDASRLVKAAHNIGARVLIDGAQAAPHKRVDVAALDCDFFVFSGHKTYGPTGIGVLYGKREVLEDMPPWRGGGEMIAEVSLERGTTFAPIPFKFEAGTPHISGAIALGTALDWMQGVGVESIAAHEEALAAATHEALSTIPGMRFIGTAPGKAGVVSFVVEGTHPYDLGSLLDAQGVAVRTGQHCTQPLVDHFGIPGTVRASFAAYNTFEEVATLHRAVERAITLLK